MELFLDSIVLQSRDPARLQAFMCDVFEFDLDSNSEVVIKGDIRFSIKMESFDFATKPRDFFSFMILSSDLIDELKNKFNFFIYRNSTQSDRVESLQEVSSDLSTTLMFSDIDDRIWQFSFHRGVSPA